MFDTLLALSPLIIIGHAFLASYTLWIFYLAVTNLARARDNGTISKLALWLGYPIVVVGILIDFLVNLVIMTILLLELPREWLVTTRLTRHMKKGSGWRYNVSKFICGKLLDTFDPSGSHCD